MEEGLRFVEGEGEGQQERRRERERGPTSLAVIRLRGS